MGATERRKSGAVPLPLTLTLSKEVAKTWLKLMEHCTKPM